MKKTAREIELKIPVEIYNKILDEVEQLRADTEKKIEDLRKFEENIVKTINDDREKNKKSLDAFEKHVRDYIEQKNIMTFKDLRSKVEKAISDLEKKYQVLDASVKKNFEKEGEYVLKILKDMDKKLNGMNDIVAKISKTNSILSREINSLKRENDKFKKELGKKGEKIKALEKELKELKAFNKDLEKKINEKVKIFEKNPLTSGLKTMEKHKKRARESKKEIKIKTPPMKSNSRPAKKSNESLLQKILPFVGKKEEKESPLVKKIDTIRRRKHGKDYIVAIAHLLRDFIKKKYGIKEQLTYTELIERINGMKDIHKDVRDQISWFFNEVQQHEYAGDLDEAYFPDLDKWAKKVVELLE